VAKTYRTTNYRILYGTSNTGFTAVHALFRTPDLANAYIAASATLGVPSFRSARDELVGSFKGVRRELVLVMGEHDYPTVVSLNGALKETIGTRALRGSPADSASSRTANTSRLTRWSKGCACCSRVGRSPVRSTSAASPRSGPRWTAVSRSSACRVGIDEDALKGLGDRLLGEKKFARALEVLEYRATSYPQSADAQVGLGDAYRQSGNLDKRGSATSARLRSPPAMRRRQRS